MQGDGRQQYAPAAVFPPWAVIEDERRRHVERVLALAYDWADSMGTPREERARWHIAIEYHDALKDAPDAFLDSVASEWWPVSGIRHGPAAAILAERDGEDDVGILDAVRFHSVGYADWELVGKILFLADYLEPGRDFRTAEHERLSEMVPQDLGYVLKRVAAERLSACVEYGFPLLPESTEFWNSLVQDR